MPQVGLQSVIAVLPDHTHFLFAHITILLEVSTFHDITFVMYSTYDFFKLSHRRYAQAHHFIARIHRVWTMMVA